MRIKQSLCFLLLLGGLFFSFPASACWTCSSDSSRCVGVVGTWGAYACNIDCEPHGCSCQLWGFCDWGEISPDSTQPDLDQLDSTLKLSRTALEEISRSNPVLGEVFHSLTNGGERPLRVNNHSSGSRTYYESDRRREVRDQYSYSVGIYSTEHGVEFELELMGHHEVSSIEGELLFVPGSDDIKGVASIRDVEGSESSKIVKW